MLNLAHRDLATPKQGILLACSTIFLYISPSSIITLNSLLKILLNITIKVLVTIEASSLLMRARDACEKQSIKICSARTAHNRF
ncbi:MAG TPA: hypothetical protein VNL13_07065 [Sulfolobales archaeon]|nr:hypothetical protein [Sulfolobales archaeon]